MKLRGMWKIQTKVQALIKSWNTSIPKSSINFQFHRLFSMDSISSPSRTISVFSTIPLPPGSDAADASGNSTLSRKPISLWPGMHHSPVTTALWEARSSIFERLLDPPKDAPPQSELLTKTPSQSRTIVIYNFSSDFILREQYRDPWNEARIGKLLEDLDALAGTISVRHCSDVDSTTRPLLLVTASVDRIVLKKPISVDADLKVVGSVIWVGKSSIEVQLDMIQSTEETDEEKLLFEGAEARSKLRKRKNRGGMWGLENGDIKRIDALLAEGRIFCDMPALADRDSILLRDTRLENSLICQPQQRNIHGRIFGGFLMQRAFELAFSTAYVFAGMVPYFFEVDHVDFLKPVSNTFYFTFTVRPEAKANGNGFRLRNVVPATEEEARRIIERMDAEKMLRDLSKQSESG
ncbi:Acyl-coenzyme A thioesterase 9, mitochondrial [Cucurbita argyrosperma subsp. argyrosperma]|nr:Acyl-coenzyme A thioesterase 9, mitochondrial [Cucurbita argyrosperma subsp. argyrosperma]